MKRIIESQHPALIRRAILAGMGREVIHYAVQAEQQQQQQIGLPNVSNKLMSSHLATVPGVQDAIYAPLYDSATYAAAGQLQLTFFTQPIGQGTTTAPGATGAKTEADTNLTNAGLLPLGNSFYMTGIEFQFYPGSSPGFGAGADANLGRNWNDVYAVAKSGWARFRVQNRDYILDGPLINFPPVTRLAGAFSVTSTLTAGAATAAEIDYATFAGAPYNIVPITLQSNQSFILQLNWPALVALPSTVAGRIFARLRGRLIRAAQ